MKTTATLILAAAAAGCFFWAHGADRQHTVVAASSRQQGKPSASRTGNKATAAQKWGHLSGRFVYDGEPPAQAKLQLNKDIEFCSPFEPKAEQLVVNQKNRGIANVVLWLEVPRRGPAPPIHQSYAKTAEKSVLLSNSKCRFNPHVTLLRTTQKLALKNEDTIAHNTAAGLKRNLPFNVVTPSGSTDERSVRKAERKPVKISCSIHAWMTGWLLVQEHPYMAVTDADGRFKIKNLPAGEWTFQVWHEIPQSITSAAQAGQKTEWKRGRVTVTIEEGENNFGEWTLDPSLFKTDE